MLRKRKDGPKKATVPLSQKAAQLQAEEGSLLDDSAKAALARIHAEAGEDRAPRPVEPAPHSAEAAPCSAEPEQSGATQAPAESAGSSDASENEPANIDDVPANPNAEAADDASAAEGADSSGSADGAEEPAEDLSDSKDAEAVATEGVAAEQPAEQPQRPAARRGKPRRRRAVFWTAVGVLVVLLAFFAYSSWDRWLRYDDVSSIQSQWVVEGGTGTVTIDGESIHLTDADAYSYEMDTFAKTLVFSFGDLSGSARYRFSADHTRLALQDGEYGPVGNFFDDLGWGLANLGSMLIGQGQLSPSFGEGSIVLVRSDSALQGQVQEPAEGDVSNQAQQEQPAVDQTSADDGGQDASAEPEVAEEQPQTEGQPEESIAEIGKSSGEPGANAVRLEDLL